VPLRTAVPSTAAPGAAVQRLGSAGVVVVGRRRPTALRPRSADCVVATMSGVAMLLLLAPPASPSLARRMRAPLRVGGVDSTAAAGFLPFSHAFRHHTSAPRTPRPASSGDHRRRPPFSCACCGCGARSPGKRSRFFFVGCRLLLRIGSVDMWMLFDARAIVFETKQQISLTNKQNETTLKTPEWSNKLKNQNHNHTSESYVNFRSR
jgi:hypothetical protein